MAVGQPATGIGGIFYIILLVGMLASRLLEKISSFMNLKNQKEKMKRIIQKLPPFALISCIMLLLYINISGVRFAIAPNAGSMSWTMDLGITGPFALSVFLVVLILFYRRARQRKTL